MRRKSVASWGLMTSRSLAKSSASSRTCSRMAVLRRESRGLRFSAARPKWTRDAARLDLLGWDYKDRLGKRIWSHEEISGGHWYSEEMAVKLNDERKG